jgi:hypothetical protein
MICAGVGTRKACLMYTAVQRFGPRWPDPRARPIECDTPSATYDFDLCTENAAPPAVELPLLNKAIMERFLNEVTDEADPNDVETLRNAASKTF